VTPEHPSPDPVSSRPPSALDATALPFGLLPDTAAADGDGRRLVEVVACLSFYRLSLGKARPGGVARVALPARRRGCRWMGSCAI